MFIQGSGLLIGDFCAMNLKLYFFLFHEFSTEAMAGWNCVPITSSEAHILKELKFSF